MEAAATSSFPVDSGAPSTPPAPVTPAAPPAPITPAAPVTAEPAPPSGGGDSIKDVFTNMNWIEVGFGILGAASLFYVINYFRYRNRMGKVFENSIQNKMDDLNIKMADVNSYVDAKKLSSPSNPNDAFGIIL